MSEAVPDDGLTAGMLLRQDGFYEQAEAEYLRAIELEPGNSDGYRRLGERHSRARRTRPARRTHRCRSPASRGGNVGSSSRSAGLDPAAPVRANPGRRIRFDAPAPGGDCLSDDQAMAAFTTGVVTPLPRIEYRYGVFGCNPMSVKVSEVTVAILIPDRSTS